MSYAGDVTATEAYEALRDDPNAVLVDVRTPAELTYVGLPVLDTLGKQVVLAQWHPELTPDQLVSQLAASGVGEDSSVYFLCRSGARSMGAANLAASAGYTRSYNVADGFEGPLDANHQRGNQAGWKAAGLPWKQS